MSRRALRQNDSSVTLFPFLAVLICTMGALIVLLVVVVQQAHRTPASTAAKSAAGAEPRQAPLSAEALTAPVPPPLVAAPREDPEREAVPAALSADDLAALQQEAEDLAWQAEMLTESREATRQRLKDQRLELSKLEDQSEQLRQQLASLESQAQELLDAEQDKSAGNETTAADLAEVQAAILRAREELARAQKAATEKRRKFAVVPYHGRHATRRRPIYIECRGDRIEIQPEGVLLVPEDFQRPIGPANPLAMALRAAREYLVRAGLTAATGEPYPLLLVRPEGAQAYAACRAALDGWDDEFGYELIDDQTELAFHPADEGLSRAMQDAIERAREQRRFELVQETAPTFRASRNGGGFVREGGRRRAASAAAPGNPSGSDGPTAGGPAAGGLAAAGKIPGPGGAAAATDSQSGAVSGEGPGGGLQLGAPDNSKESEISAVLSRDSAFPTGNPPGMSAGHAVASSRREHGNYLDPGAGGPAGGEPGQSGTQGVPSGEGEVSQHTPGSQTPPTGGWNSARGGDDLAPKPPAGGGGFGGTSTAGGTAHSMSLMQSATGQSLARTRGRNWALPNAADGAIGISRPINVVCTPRSLRINPELGVAAASQDISFSSSTQAAVQPFVSAIWRRIESWGIAGPGVYWKPLVQVDVQPGGEQRFDQLQALLRGSGLELIRR